MELQDHQKFPWQRGCGAAVTNIHSSRGTWALGSFVFKFFFQPFSLAACSQLYPDIALSNLVVVGLLFVASRSLGLLTSGDIEANLVLGALNARCAVRQLLDTAGR